MLLNLLSHITLTPKHVYLGSADAFLSQLKPDGLSMVVQPVCADTDSTEHTVWEKEVLMLSVRYTTINFSAHLLYLGMSIARELDPTDTGLHALLEWYYGGTADTADEQPVKMELCVPIGFVDGGVDTVGVESKNLTDLLTKLSIGVSTPRPLSSGLVKSFCAAYEAATAETCNPSGKHSRIGGVSVDTGKHVLSVVFLATIRTKIHERRTLEYLHF